jgi:phospholipase/carboxylesterase
MSTGDARKRELPNDSRDMRSGSRRDFLGVMAGAAAVFAGCRSIGEPVQAGGGSARFTARPTAPSMSITPGTYPLTSNPNDGSVIIPSGYRAGTAMPLVLALHGAGGSAAGQVNLLGTFAESRGFLLLAVGARGLTWDVFTYKFSYDVSFIDDALKFVFARCTVDTARIIVEGFSDGASYALGLGLANGDLFTRVVSFSPGYIPRSDSPAVGKPKFFESHGRQDPILPIDTASRRIVPDLKARGYDVTYTEFDGGHEVPAVILSDAVDWFLR